VILTGSEASVLEKENWVEEEVEFVQDAFRRGLSILGSCYGHQLLALALAGPSHIGTCPEPEIGWIPVKIKENSRLLGKRGTAHSFSLHFDEVRNLPKSYAVVASTDACPIQGFGMSGRNVWGLQIHPEIDILSARELLKNLIARNDPVRPLYEKTLASTPRDFGLIFKIVKGFLDFFS
jgi:GMP synthase-like glutamine amidotransferase